MDIKNEEEKSTKISPNPRNTILFEDLRPNQFVRGHIICGGMILNVNAYFDPLRGVQVTCEVDEFFNGEG